MKKFNLIKRLLSYSHEKQSPQRFARYAVMLIMLLTIGVGQMWAAQMYYYKGQGNNGGGDGWISATAMTVSADGFYEYYLVSSTTTHQFLIGTSDDENKYGKSYVSSGFNSTNVTNIGGWNDNNNCYCWHGAPHYILVYYPNTTINSSSDPKICAATYLPDNRSCTVYFVDEQDWGSEKTMSAYAWYYQNSTDGTNNASWPGQAMTNTGQKYNNKNIYSITLSQTYDKVIFTNKTSGDKETATLDLGTTNKGKMFDCTTTDATWRTTQYQVSFNEQSGSGGSYPSLATVGSAMPTITTLPTRTGYNFGGFYGDAACTGTQYYSNLGASMQTCAIDGDATFYAEWTAKNYTGANNIKNADGSNAGQYNVTYNNTAISYSPGTKPTKTGYHIEGLYKTNTSAALSNKIVNGETALCASTALTDASSHWTNDGNVTLYVKWEANTYSVAFDANGGTGEMADETGFTYDVSKALTANTYTRDGYFFTGWNTDAGGDGDPYDDEDEVSNLTSTNGGTVTLYAQWRHAPVVASVTGTPDDYNFDEDDEITLSLSATSTYLAAPTVKFYVNDGNSTTIVTGTRKGDGDDEDGTIGSAGSNYSTVHKATLTLTAAGTYHITAKLFNDDAEDPVQDEKGIDVTADASDVVINMVYDVTIVGGRESNSSSATTVKATPNVANGYYATAYVTALDFPEGEYGMKFTGWKLSSGITLADGSNLTDREIHFYAAGRNGTVTAQYAKREYVMLRFAAVPGWTKVYAYAWDDSNKSDENATYPGVEITSNTSTDFDGVTYYYYGYYAEGDGIGGSSTGKTTWDKVIFNNGTNPGTQYGTSNWNATKDLDLVDGHYYHYADDADGSESLYDWYVMGTWNGVSTWDYSHPADILGNSIVRDLKNQKQEFKIFRASTNEWFKYDADSDGASEEDAAVIGTTMTLSKNVGGNNAFTPDETAGYKFTLVKDDDTPTLTITKLEDSDIAVTVEAAANGSITAGAGDINIHQYTTTTITAAANAGYRFKKWTVDKEHKAYIQIEDSTSASTKIYAKYATLAAGATITAIFGNDNMIYCDASDIYDTWALGSNKLYVCLYSSDYWDSSLGTGSKGSQCFVHTEEMTRIGDSKIYYYDYSGSIGHVDDSEGDANFHHVSFVNKYLPSADNFASASVTYRGDYYSSAGRMFVIEHTDAVSKNSCGYYNEGYWMKYNEEEAGIKLKLYSGSNQQLYGSPFTFTREDLSSNVFTTTVKLNGSSEYRMELLGDDGITYYKNNGHMYTNNCTNWPFTEREKTVGYINTSGEGEYTFTLNCTNQLKLSATYPLSTGDYRIVYYGKKDAEAESPDYFVGPTIKQWTSGTQTDKVSFFVTDASKNSSMDWSLKIQSCSIDGSTVTWNDVDGKTGITFSDLDGKTGVYVFDVTQTSARAISISNPVLYEGDYYIRTDIAEGHWEAYKEAPDNKMVHSEWAEKHSDYNYYHCHYIKDLTSVKFTIANDYSSSISGEMNTDSYTDGSGKLSLANVRFSYNSATNVIKRAYIGGSAEDNEYLNIVSPVADYVFTSGGTDLYNAEAVTRKFVDMGNWVYQMDIKAYPTATAKVTAHFKDDTQFFVGSESTAETILGGESKGSTKYNLRAIYDFKNNHLITSWLADGTVVGTSMAINADLMIIRRQQGAGAQISFTGDGKSLSNVKTIYGVVQFDYDDMVGQLPNWNVYGAYGKLVYYISFPFDVNIKDIFGSAGNMNDQWIVQTYNGARRAKEGWFADSESFWEDMTEDSVMLANHGYVLIIDRPSFNSSSSVVWTNKSSGSSVYLYFPSASEADKTITNDTKTVTAPAHKCNIDRWFMGGSGYVNHMNTDSHWNMIGSPLFESKYATTVSATAYEVDGLGEETSTKFNYFYEWDPGTNTYFVTSIDYSRFKSLHGYMVQFAGTVTFTGATLSTPALVAARHKAEDKNYKINLQMTNADNAESHTFVELRENACDTFALNEDMYMMRSSKTVDLYTYAGSYDVAANVLSVGNHIIPVGMDVKKAGTYTFSMPSNFSGTVTLVDNVANTRTNLAMEDYEVVLNKGLVEGRFYLELDIQEVATAIDGVEDGSLKDGKAHKFIQNGQMYILQDGKIYDARGNRVQ